MSLPPDARVSREASRPAEFRDATFDARFDSHTLFYDAIRPAGSGPLRIIGPSLLNLEPHVEKAVLRSADTGESLPFTVRKLDRQTQILVENPPETGDLVFESEIGNFPLAMSNEDFALFKGQRVVFTLSKNNRIEWIQDWVRFYRDVHKATAVLVFDNASTAYDSRALLDAISEIDGIAVAVVVEWPFRHGPPGVGSFQYWDSNFSQLGVFEVARWRFLQEASSVLNCDIDELVVSRTNASVFETVERSLSGITTFYGDWVHGLEGVTPVPASGEAVRFRDFAHVVTPQRGFKHGIIPYSTTRCRPKWAMVPRRCPPSAQWHIHTVAKWLPARFVGTRFRFRHFREINFNWKYDRLGRDPFDPARFHCDPLMDAAFARVDWAT